MTMNDNISQDCLVAAKAAVQEFNARWNLNVLRINLNADPFIFSRGEMAQLESAPGWYTAADVFDVLRGMQPTASELIYVGRQLTVLYSRVKCAPGPRSFYWVAPLGTKPTLSDRAKLSARAA
jgi:hypothetical protein